MNKIKNFLRTENITRIVLIYILMQPLLDILSFLNVKGYIPGISTILKPLFVFGLGLYVFFIDKNSRKKYSLIFFMFILLICVHSLMLKDLMVENSVIFHEIRFMINFAYMIVLFMIFEYLYRVNDNSFTNKLKNTVVITFLIYCITILIAILTGTSAKTYEYADASKYGFKGWLDSGQIFGHALCIVFPFLIHYLFHIKSNKKVLKLISKFSILLCIIVLALIGTKVTYILDLAILASHVIIDFITGLKAKKKIYFIESGICLICLLALIGAFKFLPVKKNIDINNAVLSTDMTQNQEGSETSRKDLEILKDTITSKTSGSWKDMRRTRRLEKYYEWDIKASELLEKKYATGELHPSDMRNRQLIYNFEKYKLSSLEYKLFGIGYLNQNNFLSLERDSLMLLFSFGIIAVITVLLKPISIWIKSFLSIIKNIKTTTPETLYLFEGLSLFFCISIYAGYTFIYTNFSIYLVIICILLLDSIKVKKTYVFSKYFDKFFNKGKEDFYSSVKNNMMNDKKEFIITANPETLMTAENNSDFQKVLLDPETTIIADGIGIIKGAKILGYTINETIPGIELCSKLFEYCNELKKSIFLFGAKEEVVKKLTDMISQNYPHAIIAGYENGYAQDRQAIFKKIKALKPDIVLVALGIPEQELLIYNNLKDFNKGIFVGVGGSFDVLSGTKKRAPKIFRKLHLEWLYRIIREPKRFKRFFNSNVKYIFKIRKAKIN